MTELWSHDIPFALFCLSRGTHDPVDLVVVSQSGLSGGPGHAYPSKVSSIEGNSGWREDGL